VNGTYCSENSLRLLEGVKCEQHLESSTESTVNPDGSTTTVVTVRCHVASINVHDWTRNTTWERTPIDISPAGWGTYGNCVVIAVEYGGRLTVTADTAVSEKEESKWKAQIQSYGGKRSYETTKTYRNEEVQKTIDDWAMELIANPHQALPIRVLLAVWHAHTPSLLLMQPNVEGRISAPVGEGQALQSPTNPAESPLFHSDSIFRPRRRRANTGQLSDFRALGSEIFPEQSTPFASPLIPYVEGSESPKRHRSSAASHRS